jgi:Cu/Ag efflux pump CusA
MFTLTWLRRTWRIRLEGGSLVARKLKLPPGYAYKWSGEYEFELRAREHLKIILPVVQLTPLTLGSRT